MKSRVLSMLLAGVLTACAIGASAAPPRSAAAPPPPAHPASLEQAVRQVQHQTRGHILAADTVSRGQTNVYRIKVLTPQGKVQVMQLHSSPPARSHSNKPRSDQGGH
jgi:Spy/CpxP family protein refolding chaperone